ncbi:type II toxin-antitoxin system Phd/YefM family antitoxin [Georgenia alba]|uniref:Type II toxin-antitoxin system Phd/YefM family antitoxin n=1 Tax=Georgenia alba TaxID=2233858 RepID=A0ABW2Q5H4_9MICO
MKSISARDVTREFSRIRHEVENGESYEVTHHGRVVMTLNPPRRKRWSTLVAAWEGLEHDATFADDIESAREHLDSEVTDPRQG